MYAKSLRSCPTLQAYGLWPGRSWSIGIINGVIVESLFDTSGEKLELIFTDARKITIQKENMTYSGKK